MIPSQLSFSKDWPRVLSCFGVSLFLSSFFIIPVTALSPGYLRIHLGQASIISLDRRKGPWFSLWLLLDFPLAPPWSSFGFPWVSPEFPLGFPGFPLGSLRLLFGRLLASLLARHGLPLLLPLPGPWLRVTRRGAMETGSGVRVRVGVPEKRCVFQGKSKGATIQAL